MAIYRRLNGKIVSVAFDLCRNGKLKDGKKRRFRNLLKAQDMMLVHDAEVKG